ncbi:hypothetical protein FHS44_001917 [Streptosporangium saharense]|uniref:DUF4184 domain-containing protein n=1 Tax=Streptosporangium saharense TaxID=1706840 RepID=A0A7W7VLM6_9ACTN|nr:hypothetical protein [Streptosporangium saharense]
MPLRRFLPPTALAAGAMIPDFPYFVPYGLGGVIAPVGVPWWQLLDAGYTHRVQASSLAVDVVFALVLAGVITVCAAPARALLPQALARRMGRRGRARAAHWAWWPVAAAVGVATHLAWDRLVDEWLVAAGDLTLMEEEGVYLVGSLITLAALGSACWWLWRRPLSEPVPQPALGVRLGLLAAMGVVAVTLIATLGAGLVVRSLVTLTIDAAVLVLLAYAVWFHHRRREIR